MSVSGSFPVTAVIAATPSGVIGRDGQIPWHLSSDLKRFKKLTMGGVLVMGRKTFDSIGRPLPGRRTVVLTRNRQWRAAGVDIAPSPEDAVELAGGDRVFVVGGAEIYQQLLPACTQILLTRVLSAVAGDTRLKLDVSDFRVAEQWRVPAGPRDDVPTEFIRLVREACREKS